MDRIAWLHMKLLIKVFLLLIVNASTAYAVNVGDIACADGASYNISWDGFNSTLQLYPNGKGTLASHQVRWQLANQQDNTQGMQGPGYVGRNSGDTHSIVFWADFSDTPTSTTDDQRFDGYTLTKTRNGMAGVTWLQSTPIGFYAVNRACIERPPGAVVPSLLGQSKVAVSAMLAQAGLNGKAIIGSDPACGVKPGLVYDQKPVPNASVTFGSVVTYYAANGQGCQL